MISTLSFQKQTLGHIFLSSRSYAVVISFSSEGLLFGVDENTELGKEALSSFLPRFLFCQVPLFPGKELLPQELQTSLRGLVLVHVC